MNRFTSQPHLPLVILCNRWLHFIENVYICNDIARYFCNLQFILFRILIFAYKKIFQLCLSFECWSSLTYVLHIK
jgi:hypothetical protein